jgi:hypothetical protein
VFDKAGLLPHDEQAEGFNRMVANIADGTVSEPGHESKNGTGSGRGKKKVEVEETAE